MPIAGTAALPVREEQVRARMALRELATDRLAAGPDAHRGGMLVWSCSRHDQPSMHPEPSG